MIIILVVAVTAVVLIIGLGIVGRRLELDSDPLGDRLMDFIEEDGAGSAQSLADIERQLARRERLLVPALQKIAAFTEKFTPEKQLSDAQHQIELAGMSGSLEPSVFFTIRIAATIGLTLVALFVFFTLTSVAPVSALLYSAGAAGLGYFYPVLWIKSKIKKRQDGIVKALPDALDLLVIAVEAGLGFDSAMGKVYEKWDNDLAIAFGRILDEIQLGKGRSQALKDMSDRMDVTDVTAFTSALIQADQLGVSMASILRIQSDQMRVKRRQRAQEKAQQAPVKMMIPMVLLIFPSLWIVLMGPAVLQLLESGALGTV